MFNCKMFPLVDLYDASHRSTLLGLNTSGGVKQTRLKAKWQVRQYEHLFMCPFCSSCHFRLIFYQKSALTSKVSYISREVQTMNEIKIFSKIPIWEYFCRENSIHKYTFLLQTEIFKYFIDHLDFGIHLLVCIPKSGLPPLSHMHLNSQ